MTEDLRHVFKDIVSKTQRLSDRVHYLETQEPLEFLRFIHIDAGDSPYTADRGTVILCDATAGNITVNLPQALLVPGRTYYFHKLDGTGNVVNIVGNGGELVDGANPYLFGGLNSNLQIICNGFNWYSI